jgi:hypothetical protein
LTLAKARFGAFQYIWRLELQKRGAPHFHILFFTTQSRPFLSTPAFAYFLRHAWHRIADPESVAHNKYGCDVKKVSSYRIASAYLSKYVAKEDSPGIYEFKGRRWACSRDLPLDPVVVYDLPYKVYIYVRRWARKIIKSRARISSEFDNYLASDKTLFVYIDFFLMQKLIYYAYLKFFERDYYDKTEILKVCDLLAYLGTHFV